MARGTARAFVPLRRSAGACVLAVAVAVAVAVAPRPAGAQETADAQALFDEAGKLLKDGQVAAACSKFEEALRLLPDVPEKNLGAKLSLAECREREGRNATAWALYKQVEADAPKIRKEEWGKTAHERIGVVSKALAHLTVVVPEAVRALPGLAITRDGTPVRAAEWGTPIPVDPGRRVVAVSATGRKPQELSVDVEKNGDALTLEIPMLAPAPVEAEAPHAQPSVPPRDAGGAPATTFWSTRRTAGLVVGVNGAAALTLGALFGFLALSKKSDSNADGRCLPDNTCNAAGQNLRQQGMLFGNLSTAFFVIGGAALSAGVILFATAPRAPVSPATGGSALPGPSLRVSFGPGGLALGGAL